MGFKLSGRDIYDIGIYEKFVCPTTSTVRNNRRSALGLTERADM